MRLTGPGPGMLVLMLLICCFLFVLKIYKTLLLSGVDLLDGLSTRENKFFPKYQTVVLANFAGVVYPLKSKQQT